MSVFLFNDDEARKNVPCIEYGKQFKTRVVDMDVLVNDLRKYRKAKGLGNMIQVKAIRTKREKDISKVIKYAKDPMSGAYYGIVTGTYDDGNVKWRGIYLTDYNTFNLDNELEARCYIVLSMHPSMRGCPIQTPVDPEFEIIDENEIAGKKVAKGMLTKTALQKISTMPKESVEPFARYLELPVGVNPTNKTMKALLIDEAIERPKKLIDAWEDKNRPLFEMIAMARKVGIVKYSTEDGHKMGGTFLGFTLPDVARNLEGDEMLVSKMRSKLEERNVKLADADLSVGAQDE